MKYCSACRSQYSDLTLSFCLQDGTPLELVAESKQSTIDTIAFSDPVTAGNILKTEELNLYSPNKDAGKTRQWRPEPPKSALRPQIKEPKSSAKIWLAAFPALLALVAVGLGGWFYLKNQNSQTARFADPADAATPEIAQKTPPANVSDPSSKAVLDELSSKTNSNSDSEPSNVAGSEDVKKEIADLVELWKKAAEARKLPDYLSKYAEKVDYFDKTGASAADIRAEAQKMFDAYSEIEINLTNLRVAVDPNGTQATAVFDKEWSLETENDLTEGKAHTKLRFQKNGKEWKIVSEKYQKIYYMEN